MTLPRRALFLVVVIGSLTWAEGWLAVNALAAAGTPTLITSQSMTAKSKAGKAIFEGTVVLKQGDLVVHSDVMIVFFKQRESSEGSSASTVSDSSQTLEMVEAKGRVIIEKGESKATCGHAVYYKDQEKVILTDSPVAWQKGTRVSGPRMTLYLKEDRSVVEGGSRVLIHNEEDEG